MHYKDDTYYSRRVLIWSPQDVSKDTEISLTNLIYALNLANHKVRIYRGGANSDLYGEVEKFKPDAVHILSYGDCIYPIIRLKLMRVKRIVITPISMHPSPTVIKRFKLLKRLGVCSFIFNTFIDENDHFNSSNDYNNHYRINYRASHFTIHNSGNWSSVISNFEKTELPRCIGYISERNNSKSDSFALRLFEELYQIYNDIKFIISYNADYNTQMLKQIRELSIPEDRIEFHKLYDNQSLENLLKSIDIMIVPGDSVTAGCIMLTAMTHSCIPIVSKDRSEIEFLGNNYNYQIVNNDSLSEWLYSIRWTMDHLPTYRIISKNMVNIAAKYSQKEYSRLIAKYYYWLFK